MNATIDSNIAKSSAILKAGGIVAFTGAGVSTASGIPDYRGPKGLWKTFDPRDFSIESFLSDPQRYWSRRLQRKRAIGFDVLNAKPNAAHLSLAQLQAEGILKEIITQNTDGLHQKAGSTNVIELHGNASKLLCIDCNAKFSTGVEESNYEKTGKVPTCPSCLRALKPDVVLFGEALSSESLEKAERATRNCRSMLVVGTTASVYPAAMFPGQAKQMGASLVEINETQTDLSVQFSDVSIFGDCSVILPDIVSRIL